MRACADNLSRWPVLCCSICAALVLSVLFCPGAGARVKGPCNSCHTMHNSQGGQPMAKDDNGNPINTPYEALLISSCLGCHSSSTSQTIVTTSWGETPIVNNLIAPVNPLAGGNFYYSSGSYTYTNGHYSVGDTGHNLTASTLPYGGGFINSTAPKSSSKRQNLEAAAAAGGVGTEPFMLECCIWHWSHRPFVVYGQGVVPTTLLSANCPCIVEVYVPLKEFAGNIKSENKAKTPASAARARPCFPHCLPVFSSCSYDIHCTPIWR